MLKKITIVLFAFLLSASMAFAQADFGQIVDDAIQNLKSTGTAWAEHGRNIPGVTGSFGTVFNFASSGSCQSPSYYTFQPTKMETKIKEITDQLRIILFYLLLTMIPAAAFVYAIGQAFGAETRARATAWSTNLLAAIVIAAVLYIAVEPNFGIITALIPQLAGGIHSISFIIPAAMVSVAIGIGILIIYVIGNFLQSSQMIATAKDEMYNITITILLIFFIIGVYKTSAFLYEVKAGSMPNTPENQIYIKNPVMIDAAMAFARQMVFEMSSQYSALLIYNMVVHTIFSATMWFGITWRAMYSFNLGPMLKPLIDILSFVMQFLSLGIGEWILHIATLCMIKKWGWDLFIPLGMLFRAISPMRSAGNALLALSFSFTILYPLMFIVSAESHKLAKNYLVEGSDALTAFIRESGILGVGTTLVVIAFLLSGVFIPLFLGSGLTIAFELMKTAIYYTVVMSLVLPFINIFATLTSAKETARFFGSEINFLEFTKLI